MLANLYEGGPLWSAISLIAKGLKQEPTQQSTTDKPLTQDCPQLTNSRGRPLANTT
jgi:hypothetical protein